MGGAFGEMGGAIGGMGGTIGGVGGAFGKVGGGDAGNGRERLKETGVAPVRLSISHFGRFDGANNPATSLGRAPS